MNILEAIDSLTNTTTERAYISCDNECRDEWSSQLYIGNTMILSNYGIYFCFGYEDIISNDWCLYDADGQQIL